MTYTVSSVKVSQSSQVGLHSSIYDNQFQVAEIINSYHLSILELVEPFFPSPYRCCVELPLQVFCSKQGYVDDRLWKFWMSSRVDIVVMQTKPGHQCRKPCLAIECQSPYHNSPDAMQRDKLKADIIASVKIPLIYVEYADCHRVLRFWKPNSSDSVRYNIVTQQGRSDLYDFLKESCLQEKAL